MERRCQSCQAPLSRYNPDRTCRACVSTTGDSISVAFDGAATVHPLRQLRLRRGMTLEALAGLSGLSAPYLSMIENGHRELCREASVKALAAALRVRPVELIPWALKEYEPQW